MTAPDTLVQTIAEKFLVYIREDNPLKTLAEALANPIYEVSLEQDYLDLLKQLGIEEATLAENFYEEILYYLIEQGEIQILPLSHLNLYLVKSEKETSKTLVNRRSLYQKEIASLKENLNENKAFIQKFLKLSLVGSEPYSANAVEAVLTELVLILDAPNCSAQSLFQNLKDTGEAFIVKVIKADYVEDKCFLRAPNEQEQDFYKRISESQRRALRLRFEQKIDQEVKSEPEVLGVYTAISKAHENQSKIQQRIEKIENLTKDTPAKTRALKRLAKIYEKNSLERDSAEKNLPKIYKKTRTRFLNKSKSLWQNDSAMGL